MKIYAVIHKVFELPSNWDEKQVQDKMDQEGVVIWGTGPEIFCATESIPGYGDTGYYAFRGE